MIQEVLAGVSRQQDAKRSGIVRSTLRDHLSGANPHTNTAESRLHHPKKREDYLCGGILMSQAETQHDRPGLVRSWAPDPWQPAASPLLSNNLAAKVCSLSLYSFLSFHSSVTLHRQYDGHRLLDKLQSSPLHCVSTTLST